MVFNFESSTCNEEDTTKRHATEILGKNLGIFVLERIAVTLSVLQATFVH
jgi:hypothetical protein